MVGLFLLKGADMAISNYNTKAVSTIIAFFHNKGLNDNGVCGLLGNLYSESKLYSNNLQNSYNTKLGMTDDEYTDAVNKGTYTEFDTDRAGYGLAQWTSAGRKKGLHDFVRSREVSISDLSTQCAWLYEELRTSYKGVLAELTSPNNTIYSCAEIVVCKYEIPKSVINGGAEKQATIDKRAGFAQDFYDTYFKPSSAPTEPQKDTFTYNTILLTNNDCYKANYAMQPKGIVVHSTGCNNPTIKRYVQPDDGIIGKNNNNNDWNRAGVEKCVHAFIGKDKNGVTRTYQTLPWTICCWGCGRGKKGSYNYPPTQAHPYDSPYIQFECCEDDLNDKVYFDSVMVQAIGLCAYLCKTFNIPVDNVVSHHESYLKGFASNHKDIDHWLGRFGKDMNWFRSEITARLNALAGSQSASTATDDKIPTQKTYTVLKGDSLSKIAKANGCKWQDIAKLNNIKVPYIIKPNQVLILP